MASIPTCCITGRVAGDPNACGDCDPCGAAHTIPEAVKEQTAEWHAAEIIDRLHAAHERAKANLQTLEDMKKAKNLTADWGECSLINARRFVEELGIVLGSNGQSGPTKEET